MAGRKWTKDELVLALNLYLKLPFGKMDQRTPEVIRLATLLGRTPGAIAMRLGNFANVDPYHQERGVHGLSGGRKQVEPIWEEFAKDRDTFLFESEKLLAEKDHKSIEDRFPSLRYETEGLVGATKEKLVKTRVNQYVFRDIVMANYSGKCAISGIDVAELLVASHILPWSKSEAERLNPENGICLSALYDRAFDRGLIGLKTDYSVIVSDALRQRASKPYYQQYFSHLENKTIELPTKYRSKKEFLEFHLKEVFLG
ncbi:HNH endonuclease [Neolewinella aurantiaca]|uniref:HNH endonuclease n=1 Tax=Neolewinella aurantiaca TaxID=2602767 RepID=A0A5C7FGL6_9BACT|nr:HNH endonuclease [Neolewinella aurantiaca]TXF90120.1 HNH endonuclease [Neolewinella aurantiaca]